MAAKLLASDKLASAIAKLAIDATKMAEHVHMLAASVCLDAVKTGNVTNLNALTEATKKISKRAVMRWLQKHGPVKLNDAKDAFVLNETRVEKAKAEGFDAYGTRLLEGPNYADEQTPADTNPFKDFDLDARILALLKQAEEIDGNSDRKAHAEVNTERLSKLRDWVKDNVPTKIKAKAGKTMPKSKSSPGVVVHEGTAATQ